MLNVNKLYRKGYLSGKYWIRRPNSVFNCVMTITLSITFGINMLLRSGQEIYMRMYKVFNSHGIMKHVVGKLIEALV